MKPADVDSVIDDEGDGAALGPQMARPYLLDIEEFGPVKAQLEAAAKEKYKCHRCRLSGLVRPVEEVGHERCVNDEAYGLTGKASGYQFGAGNPVNKGCGYDAAHAEGQSVAGLDEERLHAGIAQVGIQSDAIVYSIQFVKHVDTRKEDEKREKTYSEL